MDSTGLEKITGTLIQPDNLMLQSWQEQEKNFIENLAVCRKRPTRDGIHDLRVSIKRMRSYLRLKQIITGEEWKESFNTTSRLFKSLGMLRDFDMSLVLLRSFQKKEQKNLTAFRYFLSANRSLSRKWAREAATDFNEEEIYQIKEEFYQAMSEFPDELLFEKLKETAEGKFQKVNRLVSHFKKNAHLIRKELKDVFYWLKIFPPEMTEDLVRIKSLDKMLENLGGWQDQFIFREKLKYFKKEFSPKANTQADELRMLNEYSVARQEELLGKAKEFWKEILK